MPYIYGEAESLDDLLARIISWVTNSTIHGDDAWSVVQNLSWPKGTILKAKGLNGKNNSYIGLMILDFTSDTTYGSWLLQTEVIEKQIIWGENALNQPGACFTHTSGSPSFSIWSDINDPKCDKKAYTLSGYNDLVNSNGKCLVFGVFKQFIDGLDWHEQPGGIGFTDLGMFPIFYTTEGASQPIELATPVYPGLGYPGIAMPSGEPSSGSFSYWLVKDECRLIVVTRNGSQWDMAHAGMLKPFEAAMQYQFPAVVAGSCTGISKLAKTKTVGGAIKVITGNKIDYSYDNFSMSRSLPSIPCENGTSQLALCLPDGTWELFNHWEQELKTRTREDSTSATSAIVNYYFTYERPERLDNTLDGYRIKPTNLDLYDVSPDMSDLFKTPYEPLQLIQNDSENHKVDIFGSLWGMAWPGVKLAPGEVTMNSKKCLLLPNCWEDRLWYIIPWTATYMSQLEYLNEYKEIIDYGKQFRLLIELEV